MQLKGLWRSHRVGVMRCGCCTLLLLYGYLCVRLKIAKRVNGHLLCSYPCLVASLGAMHATCARYGRILWLHTTYSTAYKRHRHRPPGDSGHCELV